VPSETDCMLENVTVWVLTSVFSSELISIPDDDIFSVNATVLRNEFVKKLEDNNFSAEEGDVISEIDCMLAE
jgi:hypothetical protein